MTSGQPPGVVSQRLLADLQARALSVDAAVAVLVEGISDYFAIETLAERTGSDLAGARVVVEAALDAGVVPRPLRQLVAFACT